MCTTSSGIWVHETMDGDMNLFAHLFYGWLCLFVAASSDLSHSPVLNFKYYIINMLKSLETSQQQNLTILHKILPRLVVSFSYFTNRSPTAS